MEWYSLGKVGWVYITSVVVVVAVADGVVVNGVVVVGVVVLVVIGANAVVDAIAT